ncbi:MAG: DNA double-strand break repair nuclease NurA [Capsulimonadales bacterium]|nr:DNA double-strand break repair nuclease NurA [Capsulimonadales bacterium]
MRSGFPEDSSAYAVYADLPDEVLQAVLGQAAEVAEGVRALLARIGDRRESLRTRLLAEKRLRSFDPLPNAPGTAAVDGGSATDHSLGTDTALAVAVGIEGLTDPPGQGWSGVQYLAWQRTLPHEGEQTVATCRGIMSALELAVLRDAPQEVVFLDGSHLTPVIALNAMLSVRQDSLRREIAEVAERYATADALLHAMTAPNRVAVVKYDSSRDLTQTWMPETMQGAGLGPDDRTAMSILLEAGEYTEPVPIALTQQSRSNWLAKRIDALDPVDMARERVRLAINEAIQRVREDRLCVTYYRPHSWSSAFRLEIKAETASDPRRLERVLSAVRSQVLSPEIREPYPQWVADRMAKSVGDALIALRTAVRHDLADAGMADYLSLVAHSYRTETH